MLVRVLKLFNHTQLNSFLNAQMLFTLAAALKCIYLYIHNYIQIHIICIYMNYFTKSGIRPMEVNIAII